MRRLASLALIIVLFVCTMSPQASGATTSGSAPRRAINLVYDDSGSMYKSQGEIQDRWCHAKYAMEVFAGMLGESDVLNVYYMSDFMKDTSAGPRLVLNGSDGAAANVAKIHNEKTHADGTPFNAVRKAYKDLVAVPNDGVEKWLVILTDGLFDDFGNSTSEESIANNKKEVDSFFAKKDPSISVMFLGMGDKAGGLTEDADRDLYFAKTKSSREILNEVTNICARIFKSNKIPVDASSKTITFDIPMSELTVFAQGANVEIKGIKTPDGTLIKSSRSPVEVKYSECDSQYGNAPVTDLLGAITTFKDDFNSGTYTLDVSGAETIEIYYKPNVDVAAYITDSEGKEVTDLANLEAGEYTLSFGFVKAGTGEKLPDSELLGTVEYEAYVTNNGKTNDAPYTNGSKLSLEEGSLAIDVTAHFLGYNSVSRHIDYSIFKNKGITFQAVKDPTFTVASGAIEDNGGIEIHAKIDGHDFTPEQWAMMDTPSIRLASGNRDFKIGEPTIEKTSTPGVFIVRPTIPGGKPSTGTYKDCDYSLSYSQQFGSETWSGDFEGTIKLYDSRSWWERNWDLFVKLIGLGIALFIIAGYLPFIKHYLPKGLKKKPYIKCVPSEPGEQRKERAGSVEKKLLSTIIPYVPQKGIIKYVPKGVTGAPALAVSGIKRRRMKVTNIKAFYGKENITFDNQVIKKDMKKFETGAALTLRVKARDWTYTCNLNQESKK